MVNTSHAGLIALGALFILPSLVSVFWPRLTWRLNLYGRRWEYAEPERLEPSDDFLSYARVMGTVTLIFGVSLAAVGVAGAVRHPKVSTAPGTVGAAASRLDHAIRQLATATARHPREQALAHEAINQVVHDIASSRCQLKVGTAAPGPRPTRSSSGPDVSPLELCLISEEFTMADVMSVASDYPTTGHIAVMPDYEMGLNAKQVCLTVASNPAEAGRIAAGDCLAK